MRRIYWSVSALLLVGAVVWAQESLPEPQPTSGAPPAESKDPASDPNVIDINVNSTLSLPPSAAPRAIPVFPNTQVYPATTRTIRQDLNGNVLYDSGVVPSNGLPGMMGGGTPGAGMMPGMSGSMSSGPMKAKQVQRTIVATQYVPLTDSEVREMKAFQEAVAALRSDDPKADKDAAQRAVQELLTVGFLRDLETRESELKDLETRVQKLRAQLDKRKAAKQEIIDLRLKTIQNEADGLEYPGAGAPSGPVTPNLVPDLNSLPTYDPN